MHKHYKILMKSINLLLSQILRIYKYECLVVCYSIKGKRQNKFEIWWYTYNLEPDLTYSLFFIPEKCNVPVV